MVTTIHFFIVLVSVVHIAMAVKLLKEGTSVRAREVPGLVSEIEKSEHYHEKKWNLDAANMTIVWRKRIEEELLAFKDGHFISETSQNKNIDRKKKEKSGSDLGKTEATTVKTVEGPTSFSELDRKYAYRQNDWRLYRGNIGVAASRRGRKHMEDRFAFVLKPEFQVYAVFDGHGGSASATTAEAILTKRVADKLSQHSEILKSQSALSKFLDEEMSDFDEDLSRTLTGREALSGSTALMAIVHGTNLTVANVGDSRGVLHHKDGTYKYLNSLHKPNYPAERERILAAGGNVTQERGHSTWRVEGILAISRALGDFQIKKYVIPNPTITTFDVSNADFMILATDGLWDGIRDATAISFVHEHLDVKGYGLDQLVRMAKKSKDNITVMVIKF